MDLRVFLVVLHDPPLQLPALTRYKLQPCKPVNSISITRLEKVFTVSVYVLPYWYSQCFALKLMWIQLFTSMRFRSLEKPTLVKLFLNAGNQVFLLNSVNFHASWSGSPLPIRMQIRESQISADPCGSGFEIVRANFKGEWGMHQNSVTISSGCTRTTVNNKITMDAPILREYSMPVDRLPCMRRGRCGPDSPRP